MKSERCSPHPAMSAADGSELVKSVECADTVWKRCRGLLGRADLPEGCGMLLVPCGCVHTCFMRFRLDLVFLSRELRVVRAARDVGPWRVFPGGADAWGVLEARSGWLPWDRLNIGVRLIIGGLGEKGADS